MNLENHVYEWQNEPKMKKKGKQTKPKQNVKTKCVFVIHEQCKGDPTTSVHTAMHSMYPLSISKLLPSIQYTNVWFLYTPVYSCCSNMYLWRVQFSYNSLYKSLSLFTVFNHTFEVLISVQRLIMVFYHTYMQPNLHFSLKAITSQQCTNMGHTAIWNEIKIC